MCLMWKCAFHTSVCVQAETCLSVSFMTGLFTILSVALGSAHVGANAARLLTLNHVGTL